MTDVLEELTGAPLTKRHVEDRVDDWVRRIDGLYAQIDAWLPAEFRTDKSRRRIRMLEQPMREAGVGERFLPTLDIFKMGEPIARLEPASLWIIGANGRLDLVVGLERYLIVDAAENFNTPQWLVMAASDRMHRTSFDGEFLVSIL